MNTRYAKRYHYRVRLFIVISVNLFIIIRAISRDYCSGADYRPPRPAKSAHLAEVEKRDDENRRGLRQSRRLLCSPSSNWSKVGKRFEYGPEDGGNGENGENIF